MCPIILGAVVEHGIEHHNAHDVLVEVEAQPVKFPRSSVEDEGVKVDLSNLDKLHEAISQLICSQLLRLSLDRHKEVTLVAGVGSTSKHVCIWLELAVKVAGIHVAVLHVVTRNGILLRDHGEDVMLLLLHISWEMTSLHAAVEVCLLEILIGPPLLDILRDEALWHAAVVVGLLLHAPYVLVVSGVEVLLLLMLLLLPPTFILPKLKVGVEIRTMLPLGHPV